MINVLFIAPYPDLEEKIHTVFNSHPKRDLLTKQISVVSVETLPQVNLDSSDVIIARGYTFKRLKSELPEIPTIEMSISGYDAVRALHECKNKFNPVKVAFVGFYGAFNGIEDLSDTFGCEIKVYIPQNYKDIRNMLEKARKDGCNVVIGGYSVSLMAKECGLDCVVIRTGEETIYQAIDEAIRTVEVMNQERIKAEMYKTITQTAKEGILYVNHDGTVLIDNREGLEICKMRELKNQNLNDVLPDLEESFKEVVKNGKEITDELRKIKDINITIDYTPVVVAQKVVGVVINFQNVTKVQQTEILIRKKMNDKGLRAKYHFDDIIHRSKVIEDIIKTAQRYAQSPSNIMISGDTGTGKELFAQSIHNGSKRNTGPFVAVNCAALPENLLESELFGYVEGAFTGTSRGGKMGLFELAHNGTLFLDEISEISMSVQSKLLRVLQEREVRRIGGDKVISVDVRIISATNKNLKKQVDRGLFRQDLLFRLDVLKIFLPPLHQRDDDVEVLFLHLLEKYNVKNGMDISTVSRGALDLLHAYEFTGNIRELNNIVERVSVLRQQSVISREDMEKALYPDDVEANYDSSVLKRDFRAMKVESEKEVIESALNDCGGNQSRAAKALGIDRTTLWRKLQKFNI